MDLIKPIPTEPIPDGYYEQQWSLEGAILRDKINEIIKFINDLNNFMGQLNSEMEDE